MPYLQLYYHLIWSTRRREPVLTPSVEAVLYGHIRDKVRELGGTALALDGWLDHTHLVTGMPAKIAVSEFVRQVKGYSSYQFNHSGHPDAPVYWQAEYAAFSIDPRNLQAVVRYVERQKQHHRALTTRPHLEWNGTIRSKPGA